MIKRRKRRSTWLLAAFAAGIAGAAAIFRRAGTCTDFVGAAGQCSTGPSLSTVIVAALFCGLAVLLFNLWWNGRRT